MGVKLKEVFEDVPARADWYNGKRIVVDGHNVAFRYLTSFRDKDGDFIRNGNGRVTSHLLGFANLIRHFRELGAEPMVVWDGSVHPRKEATVQGRIAQREKTLAAAESAKASGDISEFKRLMRGTVYFNPQMIQDATLLLETLGVRVMNAPNDGERFGAGLCMSGLADVVASEDYDCLVAGAPVMLRKCGNQEAFMHNLSDIESAGLTLRNLQEIAIVCGTDWHPGVKGLGPKTAIKAVKEHGDLESLFVDVEKGNTPTRVHEMIQKSDLSLQEFQDLIVYIQDIPRIDQLPRVNKPDAGMVEAAALDLGLSPARLLAAL